MEVEELGEKEAKFDSLGFNIISYLNSFQEISDIEFFSDDGASLHDFSMWERKYRILLPNDMKAFYQLFDGVSLIWRIELAENSIVIGDIKINKLEKLESVSTTNCPQFKSLQEPPLAFTLALDLDGGLVVIVVFKRTSPDRIKETEIWYVDSSKQWHYMCDTFTQYLRLAVLHAGVIGWQMIFSPQGISSTTQHWLGMFAKERLCLYLYHRSKRTPT